MSIVDRTLSATLPLVPRSLVRRFSARYIAGESQEQALDVVAALNREGAMATLDVLGEDLTERREAEATRLIYERLLDAIIEQKLEANISVKLTAMGLKIDPGLALEQMTQLCAHARRLGSFVRIDMEDSTCTEATLALYDRLRQDADNVGVVIQAYLRRSIDDVDRLVERRANVRLCKGIYIESRNIAYRDRDIVRRNYAFLLERLLKGGCYVGIATHDEILAWEGMRLVRELRLPTDRYEFQMLLGVDEPLRRILIGAGHRLRVYVPFGERWYQYSLRRLKENPQMAGYVLKNLLRPA
jgi:proline dehydrogenase